MQTPPAPCRPFTPCWCESNPTHPRCETVSMNLSVVPLFVLAVILIAYIEKRLRK